MATLAPDTVPQTRTTTAPSPMVQRLARKLGLSLEKPSRLTIRRIRRGKFFDYVQANDKPIRHRATIKRLDALAVPPAYRDVRYAANPNAHLQAIGRDAAGRLQYRYHPDWEKIREVRKARRLARLVDALPTIRRSVAQYLSANKPTREFALAAIIELIARTAIRPGNEIYARMHGTRGATTLLKSNVILEDDCVVLTFRAKGGKLLRKECNAKALVRAAETLRTLPGRYLFQYRDNNGHVYSVSAAQVNAFLREIAGVKISLKDFRTLMASAAVLESLARVTPAKTERQRRKQVLGAVRDAADDLANTPAICRRSYVHDTVVTAFEDGLLERLAKTLKSCRSRTKREQVLAQIVATATL